MQLLHGERALMSDNLSRAQEWNQCSKTYPIQQCYNTLPTVAKICIKGMISSKRIKILNPELQGAREHRRQHSFSAQKLNLLKAMKPAQMQVSSSSWKSTAAIVRRRILQFHLLCGHISL